jgi:hypothetical protein
MGLILIFVATRLDETNVAGRKRRERARKEKPLREHMFSSNCAPQETEGGSRVVHELTRAAGAQLRKCVMLMRVDDGAQMQNCAASIARVLCAAA